MKLTDRKKGEKFVRGKRGNKKNKDINTVEMRGYCEDTRFTVDVDNNQSEIIAYD